MTSLAAQRLREFLGAYKEEHGRGWQVEIARMMGRHQTYIGRLANGERGPGVDDIDRLVRRLDLDVRFFFDPRVTEFRATVKGRSPYLEFESFIEAEESEGRPIKRDHLLALRRIRMPGAEHAATIRLAAAIVAEMRQVEREQSETGSEVRVKFREG